MRERLRRGLQRRLELVPHLGDLEGQLLPAPVERVDELLRVDPIAALRRHAPRGRVRMHEQTQRFELGQLVADGGRRDVHPGALDDDLRPDGLPARNMLLDHPPENYAFAGRKLLHVLHIVPGNARETGLPAVTLCRHSHRGPSSDEQLRCDTAAEKAAAPRQP